MSKEQKKTRDEIVRLRKAIRQQWCTIANFQRFADKHHKAGDLERAKDLQAIIATYKRSIATNKILIMRLSHELGEAPKGEVNIDDLECAFHTFLEKLVPHELEVEDLRVADERIAEAKDEATKNQMGQLKAESAALVKVTQRGALEALDDLMVLLVEADYKITNSIPASFTAPKGGAVD